MSPSIPAGAASPDRIQTNHRLLRDGGPLRTGRGRKLRNSLWLGFVGPSHSRATRLDTLPVLYKVHIGRQKYLFFQCAAPSLSGFRQGAPASSQAIEKLKTLSDHQCIPSRCTTVIEVGMMILVDRWRFLHRRG
jgi:hypothetical protein